MAIAFRASSSVSGSFGTSHSIPKPTGTVDGDMVVIFVARDLNGGSGTITAGPSGFTLQASGANAGNANSTYAVYTKVAASEGVSWALTTSDSQVVTAVAVAYSGSTMQVDGSAAGSLGSLTSSDSTIPSTTPSVTNTMVVHGLMQLSASGLLKTYTPPSGVTEREDVGTRSHVMVADFSHAPATATGTKTYARLNDFQRYDNYGIVVLKEGSTQATGALASVTVAGYAGAAAVEIDATGGLAAVDVAGKDATLGLGTTGALASVDVEGLAGVIASGAEGQGQAAAITVVGLAGTYGLGTLGAVASVTVGGFAGAATFVVSAAGALATVAVQSFAGLAIRAGGSGRYRPGAGRYVSARSPSGTFQSMKSGVGRFFGPRGGMGR